MYSWAGREEVCEGGGCSECWVHRCKTFYNCSQCKRKDLQVINSKTFKYHCRLCFEKALGENVCMGEACTKLRGNDDTDDEQGAETREALATRIDATSLVPPPSSRGLWLHRWCKNAAELAQHHIWSFNETNRTRRYPRIRYDGADCVNKRICLDPFYGSSHVASPLSPVFACVPGGAGRAMRRATCAP